MCPKILLVDDSQTARRFETTVLERYVQCEISTAVDGAEGLRKALSEKPDLILLDVVMPKMDGLATCKAMRKHDVLRNVPIVMVTSRGEASNVNAGYRCGCNAYLTKPIKEQELIQLLRVFLGPDESEQQTQLPVTAKK